MVLNDLGGVFLGASDGSPSGDDESVVAHADPAAPGVVAVWVQGQVEGAFGADGGVGRAVPAEQGFVVPEAQFALPSVAAVLDGGGAVGGQLQDFAVLVDLDGVGVDAWLPVFPGLPAGPPGSGEIQVVADPSGKWWFLASVATRP